MKVLFAITKADEIGGAQTHVLDICRQLKIDGHEVKVIVGEDGLLCTYLKALGVDVFIEKLLTRQISPLKDLLCIFKLRKLIKLYKPDVVHLHSSKAGLLGRFSTIRLKTLTLFTVHGWSFAEGIPLWKRRVYMLVEKATIPLVDKIITVSQHDKNLAIQHNIVRQDKMVVIHNGVTLPNMKTPSPSDALSKPVKIIMVARFSEQKDHLTLIEALSKLKNYNWSLDLIGKGKLIDVCMRQVSSHDLTNRVNFLGERDDVPFLLSQSDIFCLISNWEGFPISILEAMQLHLPIIASNVGGVSEAVMDGVNGYLIERQDIDRLTTCLEKMITNQGCRGEFGKMSGRIYKESFSFKPMYKKLLNLYNLSLES